MSFRPGGDGALWESTGARRRPSGDDPRPRTHPPRRRLSSRLTARCALVAAMVLFVPIGMTVTAAPAGATTPTAGGALALTIGADGLPESVPSPGGAATGDTPAGTGAAEATTTGAAPTSTGPAGPTDRDPGRHRVDRHRIDEHRLDRDADVQALSRPIPIGDLWCDAHLHRLDDRAPTRDGRRTGGAHRDRHHEEHGRALAQRTGLQVPARGCAGR